MGPSDGVLLEEILRPDLQGTQALLEATGLTLVLLGVQSCKFAETLQLALNSRIRRHLLEIAEGCVSCAGRRVGFDRRLE